MKYDITELNGEPPPGFDFELIQEAEVLQDGTPEPFDRVGHKLLSHYKSVFRFMDTYRQNYETKWRLCRSYYNMAEAGKYDKDRLASIFEKRPSNDNTRPLEFDPERWGINMPIIFEAVQQLQSRLFSFMFGEGPEYVEIQGREKNDVPQAQVYEDIVNYQLGYLNKTTEVGMDWINTALVEGTGILVKTWDFQKNCPKDDVVDPLDYWMDPMHGDMQRWNMWRRRITLGDLRRLRGMGMVWFSDDDMEKALSSSITDRWSDQENIFRPVGRTEPTDTEFGENYRMATVDILMETEPFRWVYVVNESLVISVQKNPIPPDENGCYRMPGVLYTPRRMTGSAYGDSIAGRMLDVQDLANSIMYLTNKNFAANALGLTIMSPEVESESDTIEAGVPLIHRDPRNAVHKIEMPSVTPEAINFIEYLKTAVADNTSGVTPSLRGLSQGANQTATGTQTLVSEAEARLDQSQKNGLSSMREYHTLHLLLNQTYLAPESAFQITGQEGMIRPVEGADLFAVVGRDIMPTGFPASGTKTYWMQQGPAIAAFITQMGGNAQPVAEQVLRAVGLGARAEEVFPQAGKVGHDPRQENQLMVQGQPIPTDPQDDDIRHFVEHMTLLMDPNLQAYLSQQPGGSTILFQIEQHIAHHISRLEQSGFDVNQLMKGDGFGKGNGSSGLGLALPTPGKGTVETS